MRSEHEVRYSELLDSMPTMELASELVRLTIEHDASLEAVNHFAEFFGRVAVEECKQTQVPGQLSLSLGGRRGAAGVDDRNGEVVDAIRRERESYGEQR